MINTFTRETIDKAKVQQILTAEQYQSILRKTEVETLKIMSEQSYKNMQSMIHKGDSSE